MTIPRMQPLFGKMASDALQDLLWRRFGDRHVWLAVHRRIHEPVTDLVVFYDGEAIAKFDYSEAYGDFAGLVQKIVEQVEQYIGDALRVMQVAQVGP